MEEADPSLLKMAKVREAVEEDLEPSESEVEKSLSDDSGDEESLSKQRQSLLRLGVARLMLNVNKIEIYGNQ